MASIGSLVIDLVAKTGSFETDLGRAAKAAERRSKDIERSIGGLGRKIAGGLAAIGVGFSFKKILDATTQAEAALAKLDNAVKNNAGAAGASTQELSKFSTQLQSLTTFSDDAIQGMQSLLLTFRQIRGPEFERAQVAILDLATALGKDLNSAAILVGRALADPVKGMSALSRAGVVLSQGQKDVIKNLVETGRASEAQAKLLTQLEARFGGAAKAARNTLGGALAGLKNAFDDLLEGDPSKTSPIAAAINDLTKIISNPEVKAGLNNLAASLLAIIGLAARAAAGIGRVFGAITEHARGGNTEIDLTLSKLAQLRTQLLSIEKGFNEEEKDSLRKRIASLESELDRQTGRSGSATRRRGRIAPAVTDEDAGGQSEEFEKLEQQLKQQIELYGKVGEAAKISFQIRSGELDKLSKSEQQQVLALAKQYDAMVLAATAQKELEEAQRSSSETLNQMVASLEQQVAVFGLSEEATVAYRIAQGDLAATFAAAGAAADPLKEQLIALTAEYERLTAAATAAKEAEAAQAEVEREVAEIYESTRTPLEKFNAEIERLNELRDSGALDPATYERAAAAAQDAFEKAGKAVESFGEQFKDAAFKTLADGIYTGMTEGAEKGWKGFLEAGLETINRLVAAALAKKIAEGLFGTESSTGGGSTGGLLASFAGMFGGGKAYGGDVSAGTVYRVNEREQEFFRPNVNGKVIPLSKMAGGGGGGNTFAPVFNVRGDVTRRSAQQLAIDASRRQRMASSRLG